MIYVDSSLVDTLTGLAASIRVRSGTVVEIWAVTPSRPMADSLLTAVIGLRLN